MISKAAIVIWMLFAAVVSYATGVWLAVALIENGRAFAGFSDDVYGFAAALTLVIAGIAAAAVSMRGGRLRRKREPATL